MRKSDSSTAWLVFWVSGAVLAFEVGLMRQLLIVSWHHFAFLVISAALLGFGASGTMLTLARPWVERRAGGAVLLLALATAAAMVWAPVIALLVPVESRFAPALAAQHLGRWLLFWSVLTVPFLFGGGAIGAALMTSGRRVGGVYAANLLGSGLGALLVPVAMTVIAPERLPVATAAIALVGAAGGAWGLRRGPLAWLAAAAVTVVAIPLLPAELPGDSFKYSAYLRRLAAQDSVRRIARVDGPRARLEIYEGDTLHDLPFLGLGATPPPLSVVVIDGHWGGSVLRASTPEDAAAVDNTLMAIGHTLAGRQARVLLLGEIGGVNGWLAAIHDASAVDVVQPHRPLPALLRQSLEDSGGVIFDAPGVTMIVDEPRHFVDSADDTFDLVQLATLEGSAAGSGGVGGLGEDHLVTVEGLSACIDRLRPGGLLMACRGIQTPARDNLRLLATLAETLRRRGVTRPADHVAVVRDFLAVCTLVRPTPWTEAQVTALREACHDRQITPVWFPGIRDNELNTPDALPGPEGEAGDWYHLAARELLGDAGRARAFVDAWRFDIRAPTDDRPFFLDFFRAGALAAMRDAYGETWLTRVELAFLFVVLAAVVIAIVAAALILLPLRLVPRAAGRGTRVAIAGYFAALGLAYLSLEMFCLSRLGRLLGDPVTTAAVTIAGFLLFSGLGSAVAQVTARRSVPRQRTIVLATAAAVLVTAIVVRWLPELVGGPLPLRIAAALLVLAPAAFLMGFPMTLGLLRLSDTNPAAIPWAWGVNGFASVMAGALATASAMTWGWSVVGVAAAGLYGVAGVLAGGSSYAKDSV